MISVDDLVSFVGEQVAAKAPVRIGLKGGARVSLVRTGVVWDLRLVVKGSVIDGMSGRYSGARSTRTLRGMDAVEIVVYDRGPTPEEPRVRMRATILPQDVESIGTVTTVEVTE